MAIPGKGGRRYDKATGIKIAHSVPSTLAQRQAKSGTGLPKARKESPLRSAAKEHFHTAPIAFNIASRGKEHSIVTTTAAAAKMADTLRKKDPEAEFYSNDNKFMGWSPKEIAENAGSAKNIQEEKGRKGDASHLLTSQHTSADHAGAAGHNAAQSGAQSASGHSSGSSGSSGDGSGGGDDRWARDENGRFSSK